MHATLKRTLARTQHSHAYMHTTHDARHTLNLYVHAPFVMDMDCYGYYSILSVISRTLMFAAVFMNHNVSNGYQHSRLIYMKKMTSHSMNNHRFMKCPLLTALAHQRFLCCALPALGH